MTETKWWRCTDPSPMLHFLQERASGRKRRLLACAFVRDLGLPIKDKRFWDALAASERWADEGAWPDDWVEIRQALCQLRSETGMATALPTLLMQSLEVCDDPLEMILQSAPTGWGRLRERGRDMIDRLVLGVSYRRRKPPPQHWCDFVRDVFGNPFRPVTFSPQWQTSTAITLARQMYEARDFSAMPILADALQDAGCDNDDILNHCRQPGEHVRGCWVVDLVLGKS